MIGVGDITAVHSGHTHFASRTLLVISPAYPDEKGHYIGSNYVKYQVEVLKTFFKRIIVIVPVLRSGGLHTADRFCKDYRYDNVEIYFPRCTYIPWSIPPKALMQRIPLDTRLRALEGVIRDHALTFDLIHAHFSWPSGYIASRLKDRYRVPYLLTMHEDVDWLSEEINMSHFRIEQAWRNADCLIRVNALDLPRLASYNRCVTTIPNGYSPRFRDLNRTNARKDMNISPNDKIVFSLGPLIQRKGYRVLIEAFRGVVEVDTNARCFIGGKGPETPKLKALIKKYGLEGKVQLLGFIPDDQVPFWMNVCDVFVLSSFSEGNPTVMFEALGCGTPFIGTRVGGIPEIITSEEYGYLFEPGDYQDLRNKIIIALGREWDRAGIRKYAQQFTWDSIVQQVLELYRKVL